MGFGDFVSSVGGGNIIGSAIGAVGSLLGKGGPDYGALAAQQYANQKEFAQNGVRWKVADAQAAGIHPLAALGAQTFSYSPVMAGDTPDNRVSDALKQMGQGISRAAEAKQLAEERALNAQLVQANIDKTKAETDFVKQQSVNAAKAVTKTATPPPMPAVNANRLTSDVIGTNLDKPIGMYGWAKDHKGRTMGIVPSEDMKSRTEDVFGVEWVPWIGAGVRNIKAKYFGEPVDGNYWHGEDIGFKPYPPKRRKGFFDHVRDVMRFYAD